MSFEASIQLQQEVFQNDESCVNQNAVEIQEYFEINDLKARLQDKDKTICKLKATIKSLRENTKEENVNPDKCDLEPINKELENSVANLLSENERLCNEINHVKQVFKDQFDSIKRTRVRHKEQSDSLINKLNLKYVENEDLKAQIQDKVFVITSLKNDLRKSKGKEIVENVVHIPSATTIAPCMFKLDLEPLPPRLLQNREVHITYLRNTQEQANILWEIVEQPKAKQPLDSELDLALKCSTSNCESKPSGNKKNDRISQTPSRNKKNKVEAQPRKVNKVNRVVKPIYDVDVKHSLSNANSKILCATCNKSMFDGVHDKCLLDLVVQIVLRFGNDQIARIMQQGVSYEVSVSIEGVDLLSGSRDTNLYTISLDDMLKSSLVYLLSKASKTKSWLWHRHLSYLNFACVLEKIKKSSHQPKAEDTNQEKLYLLHMDLCGPICVASINGKSSLCYPINDNEDLGKLMQKQTLGFSLLTAMASKQFSSGPRLQGMTPATSSTRLGSNLVSQQPYLPPIRDDWDQLFQPMFDEYFNPPTIVVSPVPEAATLRAEVLADSLVLTSINQDASSTIITSSHKHEHYPIISQGFEESPKTPTFHDDPLNESPHEDLTSQGSSSNVRQLYYLVDILGKQLETDAMWCYFDAFLTSIEPKNFKQAMTEPSWIDAMQEEIHEFKRLKVWELVSCPDKVFLIKLKWIYKVKTNEFGGVLKNKARLVAQGFKQEE
ncbi:integrase, catalytic region, zinc finger, CCHC-type containing protein [Tanacetum coccineum]